MIGHLPPPPSEGKCPSLTNTRGANVRPFDGGGGRSPGANDGSQLLIFLSIYNFHTRRQNKKIGSLSTVFNLQQSLIYFTNAKIQHGGQSPSWIFKFPKTSIIFTEIYKNYMIDRSMHNDIASVACKEGYPSTHDGRSFNKLYYTARAHAQVIAGEVKDHCASVTRVRRGCCRLLRKPPSLTVPIHYLLRGHANISQLIRPSDSIDIIETTNFICILHRLIQISLDYTRHVQKYTMAISCHTGL